MALIAAYAFNEGTGSSAAEVNGGTSITGIPGWAAGRNGGNALRTNLQPGPTFSPFSSDTAFTIMFDVYIEGDGGFGYNIMLADDPSYTFGALQAENDGDLEWYPAMNTTDAATNITDGTWRHIAVSGDGTERRLFVDGTLMSTKINATLSGTTAIYIGGVSGGYDGNMRIDNLRVYNHAMTTEAELTGLVGTNVTAGGGGVNVSATTISRAVAVPNRTPSVGQNVSISASTISRTASLPAATVGAGGAAHTASPTDAMNLSDGAVVIDHALVGYDLVGLTDDVTYTLNAPGYPPVVTGFAVQAINSQRVDLSWNNMGAEFTYDIWRNNAVIVTNLAATNYSDTTVFPQTTYDYQVRATKVTQVTP